MMKFPPLTAIRHFTAAATHLSFKGAASELCVTEGAISRQIKLLEDYMGCPLFVRIHRGVQLSEEGQRLHAVTDTALFQIAQVAEEIRGGAQVFTLSVTTSFAIRWLMPRLSLFEASHPNHPINLQTVTYPGAAAGTVLGRRFDASIIYLLGNPFEDKTLAPDNGEQIMVEWLLPVCAPNFLKERGLSKGEGAIALKDLCDHRIIFNEPTGRDWRSWAAKLAEARISLDTALKFEHDDTAIQAAVAGHGIALANLAYIRNELEMGSLIAAVDCEPLPIGAHYIVSEPGKAKLPHIRAFRDWIMACAAEEARS